MEHKHQSETQGKETTTDYSKINKLGILLSPVARAVLMTVSTIVVAINSSLLRVKN